MKNFRKNKEGLFICEECGREFNKKCGLSIHLTHSHKNISKKEYFDKWLKEKDDDKCIICGNKTLFISLIGYKRCCSKQCGYDWNHIQINKVVKEKYGIENISQLEKIKKKKEKTCFKNFGVKAGFADVKKREITCLKRYGTKNPYQSKEIKEKIKQTLLKRYNVEHALQSKYIMKKFKQTCFKRYGVENPNQNKKIKEKIKQTNLKKYGVECSLQRPEIIEKIKKTNLKRYGVENPNQNKKIRDKIKKTNLKRYGVKTPAQNKKIFKKQQKSRFEIKKFKNTNLWYQGSYELDFLEKYYNKYPNITRGPRIKYIFEEEEHYYFSDFLIPSKNLVVECKNSYLAKIDKEKIEAKKKATVNNGYNYIMIIDKNYNQISKLDFEVY